MASNLLPFFLCFLLTFTLVEGFVFGWFFTTSRVSARGSHDRLAVAVSRWDGKMGIHALVALQVAAIGSALAMSAVA
jgi:hypothetical protein